MSEDVKDKLIVNQQIKMFEKDCEIKELYDSMDGLCFEMVATEERQIMNKKKIDWADGCNDILDSIKFGIYGGIIIMIVSAPFVIIGVLVFSFYF